MHALQLGQPRTFTRIEIPTPELSAVPGRLLIQTRAVSICGSDIATYLGTKRALEFPLPPGAPVHECVGVVVESSSPSFMPGDLALAIPEGNRGLAEFYVARDERAIRLPDEPGGLSDCCLIQPLSTVINAVDRLGDVSGQSAAVIGLGSIGLLFCWLLKKRGARCVVGVDPIEQRCQAAVRFGASQTYPLSSHELLHASRSSMQPWEPPDMIIEAVGHQMETLNDCLGLVRKQGEVMAFGVPDHHVYALEFETFFRKNLTMTAVVTPLWSDYLLKARDLFLAERSTLEGLITHRIPISEAGVAFSTYAHHADGILKVVLDASNWRKT